MRRGPPLPPDRLLDAPLIRVCRPDCRVHDDCDKPGKRPVTSVYEDADLTEIVRWVQDGGNVGVAALPDDDLVIIDQDADEISGQAAKILPTTFSVRTPGGGVHQYVRCDGWTDNGTFTVDGEEWGSIRANGWYAVCPPSLHPDPAPDCPDRYSVLYDVPIAQVDRSVIEEFAAAVEAAMPDDDQDDDRDGDDGGGGRRDRGRVGGADLDELDRLVDHDGKRRELRSILRDPEAGHHERLYLAGFLLDAVGLSVSETVRVIDSFNRWSNYDRDITREQVASVEKSSGGGS